MVSSRFTASTRRSLRRDMVDVWRALKEPFGAYRPEKHYMRGQGPKWREKHARPAVEIPAFARTA